MSLAPGVRIGAYEIVDTLDAGGMGEAYRLSCPRHETKAASSRRKRNRSPSQSIPIASRACSAKPSRCRCYERLTHFSFTNT